MTSAASLRKQAGKPSQASALRDVKVIQLIVNNVFNDFVKHKSNQGRGLLQPPDVFFPPVLNALLFS